jgi:hypothetical protein
MSFHHGSPCLYITLGEQYARWWPQFRNMSHPIDMIIISLLSFTSVRWTFFLSAVETCH